VSWVAIVIKVLTMLTVGRSVENRSARSTKPR
jgi:hypothetical protein